MLAQLLRAPRRPQLLRALSTASVNPSPAFLRGLEELEDGKLAEAIDTFAGAAAEGCADGNFYLGLAYDGLLGRDAADELPVEPDAAAAFRCYERAAGTGHAMAMLNLSLCYRNGDGVEAPDVAKAFDWLTRSAAAGSDRAQFNAGVALDPLHPPYEGRAGSNAVKKDAARAVEFYRQAADQGHGKAMTNLGVALYTGTGCEKDAAAAKELWVAAEELGVEQATFCLNNMEDNPGRMEKLIHDD